MGITYLDSEAKKPGGVTYLDEKPTTMRDVGEGAKGFVEGVVTGTPKFIEKTNRAVFEGLTHPVDTAKKVGGAMADIGERVLTGNVPSPTDVVKSGVESFAKESPHEKGRDIGELVSPGAYLKGGKKILGAAVGATSRTSELSARALESKGITLEAPQVRASEPQASSGFNEKIKGKNQSIAHEMVSEDTGRVAKGEQGIDNAFLDERFDTLGKHYDNIYKGPNGDREFKFPKAVMDELAQFYPEEKSLGPAGSRAASGAAKSILEAYNSGGRPDYFGIKGEGLQRLRIDLQRVARTSSDANERGQAWKVIQMLDRTVEENNPALAKVLRKVNSQYRATAALDGAMKAGHIKRGELSPSGFGAYLRQHEFQGTDAQRQFGQHAENVGLNARWQPSPSSQLPGAGTLWANVKKAVSSTVRTPTARAVQRKLADKIANKTPEMLTTAESDEISQMLDSINTAEQKGKPWGQAGKAGLPQPTSPLDRGPLVPP